MILGEKNAALLGNEQLVIQTEVKVLEILLLLVMPPDRCYWLCPQMSKVGTSFGDFVRSLSC